MDADEPVLHPDENRYKYTFDYHVAIVLTTCSEKRGTLCIIYFSHIELGGGEHSPVDGIINAEIRF